MRLDAIILGPAFPLVEVWSPLMSKCRAELTSNLGRLAIYVHNSICSTDRQALNDTVRCRVSLDVIHVT